MSNTNTRILRDPQPVEQQGKFAELPTTEAARALTAGAAAPASAEPKKPADKFETMSKEDLVHSYKSLETKIGSQGHELGQLRTLTDKLLDLKRTDDLRGAGVTEPPEPVQVSGDELLGNPVDAIAKVVDDRLKPIEYALLSQQQDRLETGFESAHPKYKEDMNDPDFQAFVQGSPYRQTLVQKTLAGDFDAAHELWAGWEEHRALTASANSDDGGGAQENTEQTNVSDDDARAQALRDAATVTAGGGSVGGDAPVYSRQALINKRIEDPKGYYDPAFQQILHRAYLEGRVK